MVRPSLELRLGHHLSMTPQLQQAIRLLQLSSTDLQQEILAALEKNPMLEIQDPGAHESDESEDHPERASCSPTQETLVETESSLTPKDPQWTEPRQKVTKGDLETRANLPDPGQSYDATLHDYLTWQMQLTPFTTEERIVAIALIDAINDSGYLESSLEEIQKTLREELDLTLPDIETVLHRLQQLDPIGVGSRTLSECLKVQLHHLPLDPFLQEKAIDLVLNHLSLLGKNDHAALKRRLNVNEETLQTVISCIQALNPKPGRGIGSVSSEYVIPDVLAQKRDGHWVVELNPDSVPNIRINERYAAFLNQAKDPKDYNYIRDQLQEARWFLKSLENRNQTILKVAQCIVNEQSDFFEQGEIAMKPLVLNQVAERVGIHESTVSRITTQKFLLSPRGTFELKYFFSSHVGTHEGGVRSSTAIRALIKQLIAEENQKNPLSDLQVSKLLAEKGIQVARRTITKYREAMTIPPSHERKTS